MAWAKGHKLQQGKYIIEKRLGSGGFGTTYQAKDKRGNWVAIKTLNDWLLDSAWPKYQQDFLNEAMRLAKLTHPHIVRIDEVIQDVEVWCIVMEYVDGQDLGHRVWNKGALPESEALRYIYQIGDALDMVHQNGLLHRDIKPINIMLRASKSEAVLIDFGIAREFTPNLTQTHSQFLSEGFAPIEQYDWRAKRGAYTDVYALAATLYSLLTKEIPAPAPVRAFWGTLEAPKQLNPDISDRVNQAILKGMALKPEHRPQSVREWLALLPPLMNTLAADNYSKLRELLAAGKWQEADKETARLMLKVAGREGWLRVEDIDSLPVQDLRTIDLLWGEYSKGRFGLIPQKRIWEQMGGTKKADWDAWCRFGEQVGWRVNGTWLSYSSLKFSDKAPEGQFPSLVVSDNFALRHQESVAALLSRKDW